jgi:lysophospholipase L1-like esterase
MQTKTRLAALLLAVLFVSGVWAQEQKFSAPKGFTLALGDSLAFGYQQYKVLASLPNPVDPTQFQSGFAFEFAKRVAETSAGARNELLNLGCPGETTASFLNGPCAYHAQDPDIFPLHINYAGAQMDAAEELLRDHRGQVNPILISLGANDALTLLGICPGLTPQCVGAQLPGILSAVGQNLDLALSRLRTVAPDAEIVLLQLYNPLALSFQGSNVLATSLNAVIGSVAANYRARVANAFPLFNETLPQPATLCALTLMCGLGGIPPGDIHASDAGYKAIADLMFEAAGYTRFEH